MTPIKKLCSEWGKICGYMGQHGDSIFCTNEEATRYSLVDPIIRALGWDLENPIMFELNAAILMGISQIILALKTVNLCFI